MACRDYEAVEPMADSEILSQYASRFTNWHIGKKLTKVKIKKINFFGLTQFNPSDEIILKNTKKT